jgi:hypothetical protein
VADTLHLLRPGSETRSPLSVMVLVTDGGWTPGPYCSIELGTELELTADELEWLLDEAGPAALERLRAMTTDQEGQAA